MEPGFIPTHINGNGGTLLVQPLRELLQNRRRDQVGEVYVSDLRAFKVAGLWSQDSSQPTSMETVEPCWCNHCVSSFRIAAGTRWAKCTCRASAIWRRQLASSNSDGSRVFAPA